MLTPMMVPSGDNGGRLAKEFLLNQLHARVQQSQPLDLNGFGFMGCGQGKNRFCRVFSL